MTDRTVSVGVKAEVSGFVSGIRTARANLHAFNTDLQKSAAKRQALSELGSTAGKVGLVAAAGLGAAVMASANFDKAMSNVQAATHESASAMEDLRQAALDAGADTAFSASEAAQGIEALAKAGVSTQEILAGGLTGALDLAAAGEMDVQAAAEAAAGAMAQFRLEGDQVPHIADLLAAAAGKAQGEVSDMVMALKQGGTVAAQTGLTLEETTGTLAAMAEQSLLGSDAGTSFKTMLAALTPNSVKAASAMEQYNIHAFDAQGNFVGMTELAGQLRDGLGHLTDEQRASTLETIFGSDAVRAAAIVYDNGAEGIQNWIDKTNDSGYAAETAAIKLDNLHGDLEAFKGSLETALIGAGEGADGPLRKLVQGATDAVNVFNDLPQPIKDTGFALGGITAVLGGGLWFTTKVMTGVASMRENLDLLRGKADDAKTSLQNLGGRGLALRGAAAGVGGLALAFNDLDESTDDATRAVGQFVNIAGGALIGFSVGGPIGAAIGAGVTGLHTLVSALDEGSTATDRAATSAEFYATALDGVAGSLSAVNRNAVAQQLEEYSAAGKTVLEILPELGVETDLFVQAILGEEDALASVRTQLDSLRDGINGASAADIAWLVQLSAVEEALNTESAGITDAVAAKERIEDASGTAAEAEGVLAGATAAATVAIEDQTTALIEAVDAMKAKRDAAIAAFDAETAYRQALKDATKAAKDNNAGIKGNTKAALENRNTLSELASAWNSQSDAVKNTKGEFAAARQAFIETATAMGVPRKAAEKLAQRLLEIPEKRVTDVTVNTSQANSALDNLWARLVRFDNAAFETKATIIQQIVTEGRANGGPVTANTPYKVGERGEELFVPATDGFIVPNHELRRIPAGVSAGGDRALSAELRFLRETVGRLESSLSRLPGAVRDGAAVGSRAGTEGRFKAFDAQPYLTTGGI